jgi:hypothetical protein
VYWATIKENRKGKKRREKPAAAAAEANRWLELNIYKFYVANVLYRRSLPSLPSRPFAAKAVAVFLLASCCYAYGHDCVTFYLILCFLATCMRQINFLSSRKRSFLKRGEEKRPTPRRKEKEKFLLPHIHTRFRLRYSHKVS